MAETTEQNTALSTENQPSLNAWMDRHSTPKKDENGNDLSTPRYLGQRMSLGAGEAGKHGTIAEFKKALKVSHPNATARERKEMVADHFGNRSNQLANTALAQVALAGLLANGFTAEHVDVSGRKTSATMRFKAPDMNDEATQIFNRIKGLGDPEKLIESLKALETPAING